MQGRRAERSWQRRGFRSALRPGLVVRAGRVSNRFARLTCCRRDGACRQFFGMHEERCRHAGHTLSHDLRRRPAIQNRTRERHPRRRFPCRRSRGGSTARRLSNRVVRRCRAERRRALGSSVIGGRLLHDRSDDRLYHSFSSSCRIRG